MKKVLFIFLVLFTSKAHTQINDASKSFFKGPYVGGAIGFITKFNLIVLMILSPVALLLGIYGIKIATVLIC
jgi:hypothetical protein